MLAKLEAALAIGGAAILLGCLVVFALREIRSDDLIDRFEEARAAQTAVQEPPAGAPPGTPEPDILTPEPVPPAQNQEPLDAVAAAPTPAPAQPAATLPDALPPDQSDWSAARRERYREARKADRLPMAVMRIEAIGLEVPVLAGSDHLTLESGVGWLERTARPGDAGNVAIAGHRDSYFRRLGKLAPGDLIEIQTLEDTLAYRVTGHTIVEPSDVGVLRATPGKKELTLITCYPFRFVGKAPQRYILSAELVDRS